ncbi:MULTISPECIES: hypothetical protein [Enterobacter]|jgi:hypothetical protein|uniref:hypothetical protein n=1 Tax=Enterobacter TaxID=547 RepID=UPI0015EAB2BF|nr:MULTISPECIES: hypothetical protein [Enterobacter]QLX99132.1 hypothetical protein HV242_15435 [Enterobacter sp. RHBSTW-00593]
MSKEESIPCYLSVEERDVAQMLGEAWNLYLKLPVEHPNERIEFCQAIHACQSIVMSRPAVRALKDIKDSGATDGKTKDAEAAS